MISFNHVNRHLWKLSSLWCLNSVAPTQEPLSRPLSVQGLRFPVLRSLFSRSRTGMTCFACVLRQVANPITQIRTLLGGETSSSFIAFMHPCPLDLCSYAEKIAKIHDFREYKDSKSRSFGTKVNTIGTLCCVQQNSPNCLLPERKYI